MSSAHPAVRAAIQSEKEIREKLRTELPVITATVKADMNARSALIESMTKELEDVQARLGRLASMRAPYSNLAAEVKQRSDQLKEIRQSLANAEASQGASATASLLTAVGEPEVSDSPVGPGRLTLAGASWLGGLLIGLGLVLLVSPISTHGGIRQFGRRSSDTIKLDVSSVERVCVHSGNASFADRRQGDRRRS